LSWPRLCGVLRGGLWRLGYEGCSLENCAHLLIRPHKLVGTMIGSQLSHLQSHNPTSPDHTYNPRFTNGGVLMIAFQFIPIASIQLSTTCPHIMAKRFCMDPPCPSQAPDHLSHRKDSSQQLHRGQSRGLLSNAQAPHTVAFLGFAVCRVLVAW